ncbi:MAG: methylated-DNA--[protein]-cysteine S-methyltransferase [Planctomycetes bacterium]|nr:methylated-DNA--[protein]-cysteine S-methyltransferase [Planctomycetota bacterium]
MSVAATARGLVRVALPGQRAGCHAFARPGGGSEPARESLGPPAPAAERLAARAEREILEYLSGCRRAFTVPVDLSGVPAFHRRVYEALLRVPHGRTVTYGRLASAAGRPGAARAVGQAMARNPVPLVVPCHRVVATGGGLGGFGGGPDLKRRLLALEGAPAAIV